MFKNDSKRSLNYYQVFDHYLKALLDKVWVKLMIIYSHDDWGTINALHTSLFKKKARKSLSDRLAREVDDNKEWEQTEFPKIIWWCWLQGLDQAPELTKNCLKSLKKQYPEYMINVVTLDNLDHYLKLPRIIFDKYNRGWISGAHLSDVIRINLLAYYGGIWIDSTVFCSDDRMKKVIEESNMFMYQNLMTSNSQDIKMSNWLMATKKNNPFFLEVANVLNQYVESKNYFEDYFVCHVLLTLFAGKYTKIWNDMPVYNNINPHMMQYVMNDQFSEELYTRVLKNSSFHKLNRHVNLSDGDSFYNHLKEGLNK